MLKLQKVKLNDIKKTPDINFGEAGRKYNSFNPFVEEERFKRKTITGKMEYLNKNKAGIIKRKKMLLNKQSLKTMMLVLDVVEIVTGISKSDIKSRTRIAPVHQARQIFIFISRILGVPTIHLASFLEGRSHGTIIKSFESIAEELEVCKKYKIDVFSVRKQVSDACKILIQHEDVAKNEFYQNYRLRKSGFKTDTILKFNISFDLNSYVII